MRRERSMFVIAETLVYQTEKCSSKNSVRSRAVFEGLKTR